MRKSGTRLLFAATWAPALLTAWLIARHAVDFPFFDEWDTPARVVEASQTGGLSWESLVAQHNESRMLVPRLVFLSLVRGGHWDVRSGMWASFLVVCAAAVGLAWLARRVLGLEGVVLSLTVLLANLVIFNPSQAFNWLFGLQLVYFLPFSLLVGCMVVSAARVRLSVKVVAVVALSALSTLSFSGGILCWLLSAPLLLEAAWTEARGGARGRWRVSLLAALLGGAMMTCLALYLRGYVKPLHHPSLTAALGRPLEAGRFVLAFLVGPMATSPPQAPSVIGAGALLALFLLLIVGRFEPRGRRRAGLLCWTLAASSVVTGALIMVGRAGFGPGAAVVDRYTTFGTPLYVALAFGVGRSLVPWRDESAAHRRLRLAVASLVAVLLVGLSLRSAADGIGEMQRMERSRRLERAALYFVDQFETGDIVRRALPQAHHLSRARRLDALGLLRPGIARDDSWATAQASVAPSDRYGRLEILGTREAQRRTRVIVGGWSFLPDRWRPPDAVVVGVRVSGAWAGAALVSPGEGPPSIAAGKSSAHSKGGWRTEIHCRWLPPGSEIAAWVFDAEGPSMHALVGRFAVPEELCSAEHTVVQVAPVSLAESLSYREVSWLRAGAGVAVADRGRLNLDSDMGVVLDNGFRVESGGWLRVQSPFRFSPHEN